MALSCRCRILDEIVGLLKKELQRELRFISGLMHTYMELEKYSPTNSFPPFLTLQGGQIVTHVKNFIIKLYLKGIKNGLLSQNTPY